MLRGLDTEENCGALAPGTVDFVCRYYGHPGAPKVLTADEARLISGNGIWIVSVFETAADRALGGAANAPEDAQLALACATNCQQPKGSTIFFAVDVDIADPAPVLPYFHGLASLVKAAGYSSVSVYGGGNVCSALLASGDAAFAWLSGAMGYTGSRAFRDSGRWSILQHVGNELGLDVGEMNIDSDEGAGEDTAAIGAWRHVVDAP